jgi:hypothetical protein
MILLSIIALAAAVWVVVRQKAFPLAMMALTEGRNTPQRDAVDFVYDVAAGAEIFEGSLVVLDSSGNAKPGVTATGLIAAGRGEEYVKNSGSAGDKNAKVKAGTFRWKNSASTDEITKAQIGDSCFIVDDETVAKTSATNTRSIAGYIVDVDADGVWVYMRSIQSADGDVVAANNLSDVTAATARANIGANLAVLEISVATLVGTGVYRVVSPVAGTITKIWSVIDGVLTTGDATLTGKIGASAITTGVLTITQSGSAAGDVDNCVPSAANVLAAGNVLSVTVGGSNATASGAVVSFRIET